MRRKRYQLRLRPRRAKLDIFKRRVEQRRYMPVRVRHHLAHRRAAGKKLLEISGDKAFESALVAADGNIANEIVELVLQAFVGASDLKAARQADGFEYGGVDYRHRFAQGVIEPRLISAERSIAIEQSEPRRWTRRGLHSRRLGSGFLSFERIYCYSSFS